MNLINFSHPLSDAQLQKVHELTHIDTIKVIDKKVQVNFDLPLVDQMIDLLKTIPLTAKEWQTEPIIINPAGYSLAAQVLLVLLHGLMGHFPAITLLRPVAGMTTIYEVYEVLNLQEFRGKARAELR